ncbi:MAG: hypothetical protein ABI847_21240 [Anaerolineales bacterium]
MLFYETLKKNPKELLALTGLARREFDEFLPVFAQALTAAEAPAKPKAKKRRWCAGYPLRPPAISTTLAHRDNTLCSLRTRLVIVRRPSIGQG